MGSFKTSLGAIVRPLGHPTELVKAKPAEVQPIGSLVVFDPAGPYYKLAPTGASGRRFGVVALANNSAKFDGKREIVTGHGTEVRVNVKSAGVIVPGAEVIYSASVAGSVDTIGATAEGSFKVVGRYLFRADEFWKDGINNTFTNAALNDTITIQLYGEAR